MSFLKKIIEHQSTRTLKKPFNEILLRPMEFSLYGTWYKTQQDC